MCSKALYTKISVWLIMLPSVLAMFFSFSACAESNAPAPPDQSGDGKDNRYCSFEISNLSDTFDLNKIEFSVNFGVNSTNTANFQAAFSMADTSDYTSHVLYTIPDLSDDDYSFAYAENAYTYKKTVKLGINGDYFTGEQGTIQLQFCLYVHDDADFSNASTGYAYKIHYTIAENSISFVSESGFIIRHP